MAEEEERGEGCCDPWCCVSCCCCAPCWCYWCFHWIFGDGEERDPRDRRLRSTGLLIRPESPCVADGAEEGDSASRLSSLSLSPPSTPASPSLARRGEDEDHPPPPGERDSCGEEAAMMGESPVTEASRLLGRRYKDSQSNRPTTSAEAASGSDQRREKGRRHGRHGGESRRQRRARKEQELLRRQQEEEEEQSGMLPDDVDDGPSPDLPQRGGGATTPLVDQLLAEKEAAQKRFKAQPASDEECPICLEPFDKENPAVFLNCGHAFHLHCTYEWLERSNKCAVCATLVEAYEEDEDEGERPGQQSP